MTLNLTRPIIFFDLETTGTSITHDRIVELSLIKVYPDGTTEEKSRRINPEMPIPPASTAIHHISDADVADAPTFKQISHSLLEIFEGCDIAGYNSNKFDVPLLMEEFARAGLTFEIRGRRFIDVQTIFHKMEQRTLIAAYKFYCGKNLEDAHSATADTRATYEVLLGQLERYPDLKNDVDYLSQFSGGGNNVDLAGRIVLDENGRELFNFGKHKGKPVEEVLRREPSFYDWIMQGDFPKNTKDVLTALKFKYRSKQK
ncbi:MAG: 3'-5' exonuclease [Bacteroidales bacterium]|nr:3'-5' exonuclease [Bacteroidales bacterium]MBD5190427.1 3'-5' exonuclease [Bacteroidales bacterium]MBD5209188.1 3'-5' exonuclease [Bacteroidales bacterium]MDE6083774.1 3'-5' exonuclease [Muribaculaceae bacterium]